MQIVCSFVGGAGHLVPQIPLHRALREAGHTLLLVGRESAARHAPSHFYLGTKAVPDRRSQSAVTITPLLPLDVAAEVAVVADYFAGDAALRSAAAIDDLLVGTDLVVCDELDFGAIAAAQKKRIPVIVVSVIASGALVRPGSLTVALDRLRHQLGVPESIRPRGDLFVVPFDPSMRDPNYAVPGNMQLMRPDAGAEPDSDGSLIATLGTEFNTESGDLFNRILDALGNLEARVQVAIGRDLDPARFGNQPVHVEIHRYIDFDAALPRASIVLHHGGSGLLVQSVLAGAPQIVFPMGADQPFNAALVDRLGLGMSVDAQTATQATILDSVRHVLADVTMRDRTMRLRDSLLALPHPAEVVANIERLLS